MNIFMNIFTWMHFIIFENFIETSSETFAFTDLNVKSKIWEMFFFLKQTEHSKMWEKIWQLYCIYFEVMETDFSCKISSSNISISNKFQNKKSRAFHFQL